MQPCKICQHKGRYAIEAAILDGQPLRRVAELFNVSRMAVSRHHQNHMVAGTVSKTYIPPHDENVPIEDQAAPVKGNKKPTKLSEAAKKVAKAQAQFKKSIKIKPEKKASEEVVDVVPMEVAVALGGLQSMSQREQLSFLIQKIFDYGLQAGDKNELITAIVALDKAGQLLLRAAKLWPEKDAGKDEESKDAQDKLLEAIRRAQAMPEALPYPEWVVGK